MFQYSNYTMAGVTCPHIIQDLGRVANFFYGNAPSMEARIHTTGLNYFLGVVVFPGNSLTKDGNPAASNVIREFGGVFTNSYSAYKGYPIANNVPEEKQDALHVSGQVARFLCKAGFQLVPGDKVSLSRVSNIACDSIGISATNISRTSQREGQKLYYFKPYTDEEMVSYNKTQISAYEYVSSKVDLNYAISIVPRAIFKASMLDQVGEVIKIVKKSAPVTAVVNKISSAFYEGVSYSFGLGEDSKLNYKNNIYDNYKAVAGKSGSMVAGGVFVATAAYEIISSMLPDITITGTIMLGTSNAAVNYIAGSSIAQGTAAIIGAGTLAMYKGAVLGAISSSAPVLLATGAIMMYDPLYDSTKEYIAGAIDQASEYFSS